MNKWYNYNSFSFYKKSLNPNNKMDKMIIFDLDSTLIKTKSGRVFPANLNDWQLCYENVSQTINNLQNTITGIITNQKGLKTEKQLNDFQTKLNNIMKEINMDFVFVSLKDDGYRKPMIKSIEYIKENFLNNTFNEFTKIIYVGDACGRKNDHSDTDIKFAYNCNFEFMTPEKFFKIKTVKRSQTKTITYSVLEYYEKSVFEKMYKDITNNFNNNKIFIMMIGFPGCGKSYLRKKIIKDFNNFKYINNDDIKNKVNNEHLISKDNNTYNYIINDNTNMNKLNRTKLLNIYKNHHKIGIFFDYDMDLALHLNYVRMYWYGENLVNKLVYRTLNKNYTKPDKNEFDVLITFDKLFPEYKTSFNYYY